MIALGVLALIAFAVYFGCQTEWELPPPRSASDPEREFLDEVARALHGSNWR